MYVYVCVCVCIIDAYYAALDPLWAGFYNAQRLQASFILCHGVKTRYTRVILVYCDDCNAAVRRRE